MTKTVAPAQGRPKRRCRESTLAMGLPSVGECWVLRIGTTGKVGWTGGDGRVAQPDETRPKAM
jgi:hypothetical protein